MSIMKNPVQVFIRNLIRLVVFLPLWLIFALGIFRRAWGGSNINQLLLGGVITIFIFWLANIVATFSALQVFYSYVTRNWTSAQWECDVKVIIFIPEVNFIINNMDTLT